MKKSILSIAVFALCSNILLAQSTETDLGRKISKFRFGLFIAPGIASMKPASATTGVTEKYNVSKGKGKTAFAFGVNAEKPINNKYSLVTGVGLDWQGGNIAATKTSGTDSNYINTNVAYNLKYIQVPLGLKLKATSIDKFQIYGQVGLDASVLIGNKTNSTTFGDGVSLKRTLSPLTLGMDLGIGTEFRVSGENSAYVALMYRNGFTDATIPQLRSGNKWQDGNIRTNVYSLRIGYFF